MTRLQYVQSEQLHNEFNLRMRKLINITLRTCTTSILHQ
jgi:hypothetical protein